MPSSSSYSLLGGGGGTGFSPLDLPNLKLWITADDSTKIVASSPPDVDSWQDKSSSALLFEQSTGSLKPDNNGSVNGRTAIVFDGSDDVLTELATPFTATLGFAFMVVQIPSTLPTTNGNIVACGNGGLSTQYFSPLRYDYSAPNLYFGVTARSGATINQVRGDTAIVADTTYLVEVASDDTAWTMRVNNVAQTLTVIAGSNTGWWAGDVSSLVNVTLGDMLISGGAANGKVRICEAGIVDGSVPNTQYRTRLRTYLAGRWGITL